MRRLPRPAVDDAAILENLTSMPALQASMILLPVKADLAIGYTSYAVVEGDVQQVQHVNCPIAGR